MRVYFVQPYTSQSIKKIQASFGQSEFLFATYLSTLFVSLFNFVSIHMSQHNTRITFDKHVFNSVTVYAFLDCFKLTWIVSS